MLAAVEHRGTGMSFLVTAVFCFLLAGTVAAADAVDLDCPIDSTRLTFAIAGGVQHVDLPRFDVPGDEFGVRTRVAFDAGVVVRRWFEPHIEVAFAYLGGSDSLDAVLAGRGSTGASLGTLVQAQAGARWRWARCGRVQPYAQIGAGAARLRLAAPDELDRTATDPITSAGGGVEVWLHRRVMLRNSGAVLVQFEDDGHRTHWAAQIAVAYAFPR
jgi:hypothetical protein